MQWLYGRKVIFFIHNNNMYYNYKITKKKLHKYFIVDTVMPRCQISEIKHNIHDNTQKFR